MKKRSSNLCNSPTSHSTLRYKLAHVPNSTHLQHNHSHIQTVCLKWVCLLHSILCPTKIFWSPNIPFLHNMFGQERSLMSRHGLGTVSTASEPRYSDTPSLLSAFSTPDNHFDNIHIDLITPLSPSNGFTYILSCVYMFTCSPEAISLQSITAEWMARSLSQNRFQVWYSIYHHHW